MTEAVRRRETALLAELRRVTAERQSAIDTELDRIRYNITRFVTVTRHSALSPPRDKPIRICLPQTKPIGTITPHEMHEIYYYPGEGRGLSVV